MKVSLLSLLLLVFIFIIPGAFAQKNVIKDIKTFGARGDGKTNDHEAFQKAAIYFNKRGGWGRLIISKGTYIVGKQTFTGGRPGKPAYEGEDVLHFTNLKNFEIAGTSNSTLIYKDSLRFGTFKPTTGLRSENGNNFFDVTHAGVVGICILFDQCTGVKVTNLSIDGNNKGIITGGVFGDVGRQLPHYGIFIKNSRNVDITNVSAHHLGLDGICVSNIAAAQKDNINLKNSRFEYNARQGLSWIGGNDLEVTGCKFDNTGKGAFASAPTAGVDIEAEVGPISGGNFTKCEFVNNGGAGLLADAGNSRDCKFIDCIFWGATNWSIWVTKPGFTFQGCSIYGSPVYGYNSPDQENATRFIGCNFEDKPYQGKEPFGNFLIESNNARRTAFTDCKFIANKKMLCWIAIDAKSTPAEKYQFTNCSFTIRGAGYPKNSFVALMRGMAMKNCTFQFTDTAAKSKQYFFEGYTRGNNTNVDLGGNKIIYAGEK